MFFKVFFIFFLACNPIISLGATRIGTNISTGGNLTVDGALKFTSGAASNYILSTDASGNSTWIAVGSALGNATTDDLPEGATNKFFNASNLNSQIDSRISTQRGLADGLAPLNESSLIPMSNLSTGVADGLATLDGSGKLTAGQMPSFAISSTYSVADITARDALTPNTGDVAIVIDAGAGQSTSYIYDGASWVELLTPLNLYLAKSNNLSDLTSPSDARDNLGLGSSDSPTFAGLTITSYADFTNVAKPTHAEGRLFYDSEEKSLAYYNDLTGTTVNIGQEERVRVYNNTGSTIYDGQAVYITGSFGGTTPTIGLAKADNPITARTIGITTLDILSGGYGDVNAFGVVHGLNTSMYSDGDRLYLSAETAGSLTATKPSAPNLSSPIGFVVKSDAVEGAILAIPSTYLPGLLVEGSVVFSSSLGEISEDTDNFFWDNTEKRLGIGNKIPAYTLDVTGDIKTGDGSLNILGSLVDPDPAGVNGAMYYNTSHNKFRCYENSVWKDCDTSAGVATLQSAYTNGATITNTTTPLVISTLTGGGDFNVNGSGAISLTPDGALTLTSGTTATWGTDAGNLNLVASGATTANVQIGSGVTSSAPDLLVLDLGDTEPAGTNGALYYDTDTNKFRCYQNGSWSNCISATSSVALSSVIAATDANSINNADNRQTWNWKLTTAANRGMIFGESTASTATGSPALVQIDTLGDSTAMPLHILNLGDANSIQIDDQVGDATPFVITNTGQVGMGTSTFDPLNAEKLRVEAVSGSKNILGAYGDANSYLQLKVKNRNSGLLASTDIVAEADNGTETSNFIDMGIASSNYSDLTWPNISPNDTFILSQSEDFIIDNSAPGKSIQFYTDGTDLADEKMRIEAGGNIGIGTTAPGSKLDVKGAFRLSGATSGFVGLAPSAEAGSTTYILPSADGAAGQALVTDGSGGLSWETSATIWQRTDTTVSPLTAGDTISTSGNILTTGSGAITSAGLLTGSAGLSVTSGTVNLNASSNNPTNINTGNSTGAVSIGNSLA
ncbi:MAG: hypothetical protein WCX88_02980, partial [Patescibacteria group bacterium]